MPVFITNDSPYGLVPIGVILGWTKSFSGVPTLAAQGRIEYVEYNGQVLSDANSPLNGKTLPSLNSGQTRFLRGGATSGTLAGSTNHTHTVTYNATSITGGTGSPVVTDVTTPTGTQSIQPVQSYDVVWIGRVK